MVNELVRGKASEPPVLRWQDDVEAAQWGRELATCLQPTQHRSSRDQGATQRRHRFRCREVMATFADEVIQEWAARGQCSGVERVTIGGPSEKSGRWILAIAKSNGKRYFLQSRQLVQRGCGRRRAGSCIRVGMLTSMLGREILPWRAGVARACGVSEQHRLQSHPGKNAVDSTAPLLDQLG